MSQPQLDRAGRRRSPATMPGFHAGRSPRRGRSGGGDPRPFLLGPPRDAPAIIDGAAGFIATEAGQPVAVLAFTIVDGRITAIDALHGPARLAGLGLEAFVADPVIDRRR